MSRQISQQHAGKIGMPSSHRRRRARRVLTAGALVAMAAMVLTGCTETAPQPAATSGAANLPLPAAVADRLNSSELGLSMAIPRALRVGARSPEDHEIRLAGRAGDNQSLIGRLTLITRAGREAAVREALGAIEDTWNRALFNQQLSQVSEYRPQVVPHFHPVGQDGLTIIKKRLVAKKPLPTPRNPESINHKPNEIRILALAYLVIVAPAPVETGGAAAPLGDAAPPHEKYMLALFVLENTSEAEAMIDDMIKSVRPIQ